MRLGGAFRAVVACLALCAMVPSAWAREYDSSSGTGSIPYTRTLWRASDGLPEGTVQALLEDQDGSLWIGTTGGLSNFDGSRIRLYSPGLTQAMGVNSVFCLARSQDGSIWIGAEGGGLLRLRNGQAQVFGAAQGLTDGFVRSILEDSRHRLWVGTDRGLYRLSGDRLERVDGTASFPEISVHSLEEDGHGRIWVGGSHLVALEPDGTVTQFTLPGAYSQNRVKRIMETRDGTLWVGTVGGLQRFRDGRFEALAGITATVRSLLQSTDGTLWIGTIGDGIWTFQDNHLKRLLQPGLLPSDTVLSLLQDKADQVWVGTQAGLVRLNRTPISVVSLPRSGDPDFETISGDRRNVWVAAQKLYVVQNGIAHQLSFPGLQNVSIRNVFRARDGALWVGTDGSGAFRLDRGKLEHFSAPDRLTNNFIRAFLETRAGELWIATDEGVNLISKRGVLKLNEHSGLVYFSTRCLLEARDGSIWIGTDRGVSHWTKGSFQQDAITRSLAHEKVWSILEDRDQELWFGTRDHGLFRFHGGRMEQYTTEQGLPVNSIYQILQDTQGNIWLTGADTIASLESPEHISLSQPLRIRVYTMPYGSEGAQMYGGRQPAGYLAPDGSVWFPTSRGPAHVAPDTAKTMAPPPRAIIDVVSVDGQARSPNDALELSAHVLRLSFTYSAVSLRPQNQVRFRYRLDNFDQGWTFADAAGTASYTNLPAGHYRFHLQAFDTSRPDAVTEAETTFAKEPLLYQRAWFDVICVLLLGGLGWLVYWARLRQVRSRFTAVLKERTRLAREMHDTVIQGCTGVSALLEAVASTAQTNPAGSSELLDYAREQTRLTINEARQAVWDMRHEHEADVDLVAGLRGIATQMAREYGRVITIRCGEDTMLLGASAAHEVLMTVREAVYNAVRHGDGERILLDCRMEHGHLELRIEDNGPGFAGDLARLPEAGHFGIQGMRERMERLGGSFELSSRQGAGTLVKLGLQQRSRLTVVGRS